MRITFDTLLFVLLYIELTVAFLIGWIDIQAFTINGFLRDKENILRNAEM